MTLMAMVRKKKRECGISEQKEWGLSAMGGEELGKDFVEVEIT